MLLNQTLSIAQVSDAQQRWSDNFSAHLLSLPVTNQSVVCFLRDRNQFFFLAAISLIRSKCFGQRTELDQTSRFVAFMFCGLGPSANQWIGDRVLLDSFIAETKTHWQQVRRATVRSYAAVFSLPGGCFFLKSFLHRWLGQYLLSKCVMCP